MIPAPRNALCSYHYFRDFDLDRLLHLRVIGDSGAFSAKSQGAEITTPDLGRWAQLWRHKLSWVASLDVIGDLEATRRNWHEMVDEFGIPAVPTIHFGAAPEAMDYYANLDVDFLGLGGLVGRPTAAQMRWLIPMFKYARDHHPTMRFHGWGVTTDEVLRLPFFSVDSSSWTTGVRYGRVNLRDPRSRKVHPLILDGKSTYDPVVARLLRDHYGVNPSHVATSGSVNRKFIVKLSALSASVQEQNFRKLHARHPITTPVWGQMAASPPAPHLHLAETSITDLETVASIPLPPHLHLATMQINNTHPELLDALVASGGTTVEQPEGSSP